MAKFFGKIGYGETIETAPGVYQLQIVEKNHYGDLLRNIRRYESSGEVNDNLNIANSLSIIADPFAMQNFHSMRYVEYMGSKWKVTSVEVQYPRLILSIGGVYNDGGGEETGTS